MADKYALAVTNNLGRNTQISIEDENQRQLAIYKVNYGSKLYFNAYTKKHFGSFMYSQIIHVFNINIFETFFVILSRGVQGQK